jgi:hypothetical protein
MNLALQLSSSELDNDDLQALTRQLSHSIADATDVEANLPSGDAVEGAKGELVTIGLILLKGIPAVVALCNVLTAYFSREPSLEIIIEKPNGAKVSINAKNFKPEALQSLLSQADSSVR